MVASHCELLVLCHEFSDVLPAAPDEIGEEEHREQTGTRGDIDHLVVGFLRLPSHLLKVDVVADVVDLHHRDFSVPFLPGLEQLFQRFRLCCLVALHLVDLRQEEQLVKVGCHLTVNLQRIVKASLEAGQSLLNVHLVGVVVVLRVALFDAFVLVVGIHEAFTVFLSELDDAFHLPCGAQIAVVFAEIDAFVDVDGG